MLIIVVCSPGEERPITLQFRNASMNQFDVLRQSAISCYGPYSYWYRMHDYYHWHQVLDSQPVNCTPQNGILYTCCPSIQLSQHRVGHLQAVWQYNNSSLTTYSKKRLRIGSKPSSFGRLWVGKSY
jgi:hypothetical protein